MKKQRGFTLIELLIVIALIGIGRADGDRSKPGEMLSSVIYVDE